MPGAQGQGAHQGARSLFDDQSQIFSVFLFDRGLSVPKTHVSRALKLPSSAPIKSRVYRSSIDGVFGMPSLDDFGLHLRPISTSQRVFPKGANHGHSKRRTLDTDSVAAAATLGLHKSCFHEALAPACSGKWGDAKERRDLLICKRVAIHNDEPRQFLWLTRRPIHRDEMNRGPDHAPLLKEFLVPHALAPLPV